MHTAGVAASSASARMYIRLYAYIILYYTYILYIIRYYVCVSEKCAFVKAANSPFWLNNALRSITLLKTSYIYTHIFENKLFPTTAVQQRQHVDAVGCRTFLVAAWSACLALTFWKFLQVATRFVRGEAHPLAPPWLWARFKRINILI